MLIAPKQGEPKKKTMPGDDKPWYWCPKHSSWVRHSPDKCKGKGFVPPKGKPKPKEQANQPDGNELTVSRALTAIMEAEEDLE